jgi:hemoglobin-like flavoprotein
MKKSDSIKSILSVIFGNDDQKTSEDIKLLAESISVLANEVTKMTQMFVKISKTVSDHSFALEQITAVQEYMLSSMGEDVLDAGLINKPSKLKNEKPN